MKAAYAWKKVRQAVDESSDSGPTWWRAFCKQTLTAILDHHGDVLKERDALLTALNSPLSEAERRLIDKHCDWIAFGHAWNAVMKHRRAALTQGASS